MFVKHGYRVLCHVGRVVLHAVGPKPEYTDKLLESKRERETEILSLPRGVLVRTDGRIPNYR